jgi:hypothetical protein
MDEVFVAGASFTLLSGGQTGADRAALDRAIAYGLHHGGWCPRGRRTEDEDGILPEHYALQETTNTGMLNVVQSRKTPLAVATIYYGLPRMAAG